MSTAIANLTIHEFWKRISETPKTSWTTTIEYVLNEFGTALHCNRFAVGESIETATTRFLNTCGIQTEHIPSATRIDCEIKNVEGVKGISLKFVSTGNHVILHNSQRKANTDMDLSPTLLFRMNDWWFLHPPTISDMGIDVKSYMKNTSDSLQLSFNLLKELKTKGYPYTLDHTINYKRTECVKKSTSDLFYRIISDHLNPETSPEVKAYLQSVFDSIPSRACSTPIVVKKRKREE